MRQAENQRRAAKREYDAVSSLAQLRRLDEETNASLASAILGSRCAC